MLRYLLLSTQMLHTPFESVSHVSSHHLGEESNVSAVGACSQESSDNVENESRPDEERQIQ